VGYVNNDEDKLADHERKYWPKSDDFDSQSKNKKGKQMFGLLIELGP